MILGILMILAGVSWVVVTSFFRGVVDPWFNAYPLLSTLVMATVLLTYATILLLSGSNFGKPLPVGKKNKDQSSAAPPLHYILQWSLVGAIFMVAGFFTLGTMPYLSGFLWLTGTVILLSQFLFLMIPSTFRQEGDMGKVDLIPNRLKLHENAYHFWDTAILAGAFFLVTGALIKPISTVSGLLSIGTGAAWILGAISFALVSTFYLSGIFRKKTALSTTAVPEETLTIFPGNNPTRKALVEAYMSHIGSLSLFSVKKNGILLRGPSEKECFIFTRALAGETGRAYLPFSLSSIKGLSTNTTQQELRNLLYKISLYKPVLLHVTDYREAVTSLSHPERETLKKFLLKLLSNKHSLVLFSLTGTDELPPDFTTPPVVHWVIDIPPPDVGTRVAYLRLTLRSLARNAEVLPGQIPLLTAEMIDGYDLFKLAEMMEGFSVEDIEEILIRSLKNAKSLRRSLRQLDIDVSIRRKMQGWQDPTLEPMETIRAKLTEDAITPALVVTASEKILKQKRHAGEALLIVGKTFTVRQMLAQELAQKEKFHFASIHQKEFARDSLGAFRNFIIQNKKQRPVVLYVDPLEILFPRVQLSHFSYHGEIYNQKVIELSQVLQEKQFWLICGTTGANEIDPMILRKFSRVQEISDIQKEFIQDVESYAMEKLMEGQTPEGIDFSKFHLFTEQKSRDTRQQDGATENQESHSFVLSLPAVQSPPIPGFYGRTGLQEEILRTLEASRLNIRKDGSKLRGTFLFLGPAQSGRKALSEALSQQVFGDNNAFVYRDMGLYDDLFFSEQFIRKPVGTTPTNPPLPEGLWDLFSESPARLVYMDNVERAHPSLWSHLLPIIRDGIIQWQDKIQNISQSIFVLASSLFSPQDFLHTEPWERPNILIRTVQNNNRRLAFLPLFQPPFLKNVDLILPFPEYTPEEIRQVLQQSVTRTLEEFAKKIPHTGSLGVAPDLFDHLLEKIDVPRRGMSGLEPMLQMILTPALSKIRESTDKSPGPHDYFLYWDGAGITAGSLSPQEKNPEEMATVSP